MTNQRGRTSEGGGGRSAVRKKNGRQWELRARGGEERRGKGNEGELRQLLQRRRGNTVWASERRAGCRKARARGGAGKPEHARVRRGDRGPARPGSTTGFQAAQRDGAGQAVHWEWGRRCRRESMAKCAQDRAVESQEKEEERKKERKGRRKERKGNKKKKKREKEEGRKEKGRKKGRGKGKRLSAQENSNFEF